MAIFSGFLAITGLSTLAGSLTIFGLSPALSGALISVGRAVLYSAASAALNRPPRLSAQEVQATIAQPLGPRVRGYGTFLLGGTRAFWEAKNGNLYQVVASHHGPITEVLGWLVDGEAVTLDGSGDTTSGAGAGAINISAILTGDGGDYARIRTEFPALWTTDHRMAGIATYLTVFNGPAPQNLSQVFPRAQQTVVQMEARLSPVIDPRTGVSGFSDLTGPCALDYLTDADGYRIAPESIDIENFAAFTDLCDQNVPLKAGGTQKRYRIGGYYTLEDAPKEVMARILATADAQLYMTAEGKVGIMGGQWADPDVTIGPDDILSYSLQDGFDEFTDFNILKGNFTSPDHRYQVTECAELVDEASLLTQPERVDTHAVEMCPDHVQMQRLMRGYRATRQRQWTGTVITNLVGMKARFPRGIGRHVIRLVIEDLQIDQTFEVLSHSYSVADRTCTISVASLEDPYGWVAATDEKDPPPPLADLIPDTLATDPPAGLALSLDIVTLAAGQNAVRVSATVDEPDRENLQLYLEIRVSPGGEWSLMQVGLGAYRGLSEILQDGETYDVRASWVGFAGYSDIETILAVSNPTAPDAVFSLTADVVSGSVVLSWTNGTAGYYQTRIYRGTTVTFGAASLVYTLSGVAGSGQIQGDSPGTGTWFYWAATINASFIEATPTGPASATI